MTATLTRSDSAEIVKRPELEMSRGPERTPRTVLDPSPISAGDLVRPLLLLSPQTPAETSCRLRGQRLTSATDVA